MNKTWIRNIITTSSIALMLFGFIENKPILILPTLLVLLAKDTKLFKELFKDESKTRSKVDSIGFCINVVLLIFLVGYYIISKTMK